jgi:hypothetical protein
MVKLCCFWLHQSIEIDSENNKEISKLSNPEDFGEIFGI